MKSVILKDKKLNVVEKDCPKVRPDGVLIELKAAPVLSYTKGVVNGTLPYMLPEGEFIFGSDIVGVVKEVGSEVFDLEVGTLVHAGSQASSRGSFKDNDDILIGLTGMSEKSVRVQNIWKDGAFTQVAHYPVDAVTPLDKLKDLDVKKVASVMYMAVPYGGLLSLDLKPSESVIIGGATGNFGAFGILVALAMGASRVVPTGRDEKMLESFKKLDPNRVFPVVLTGDSEIDTKNIYEAAGNGADCYLDITGGGSTDNVLSAIRALKMYGRVSLMGALLESINIPYVEIMVKRLTIKGNYMYPSYAVSNIEKMIDSKMIDLDLVDVEEFSLDDVEEAVESSSKKKAFSYNVLV